MQVLKKECEQISKLLSRKIDSSKCMLNLLNSGENSTYVAHWRKKVAECEREFVNIINSNRKSSALNIDYSYEISQGITCYSFLGMQWVGHLSTVACSDPVISYCIETEAKAVNNVITTKTSMCFSNFSESILVDYINKNTSKTTNRTNQINRRITLNKVLGLGDIFGVGDVTLHKMRPFMLHSDQYVI